MLEKLSLPVTLDSWSGPLVLRRASAADLDSLMLLLADDPVSASRGDRAAEADRPAYSLALEEIVNDPSNDILLTLDEVRCPVYAGLWSPVEWDKQIG